MARRPFDPAERGWKKTEYRQGDVTDTASVRGARQGRRRGGAPRVRDPRRERRHARAERRRARGGCSRRPPRPAPSASVTRRASPPTASTTTTRTGSPRTSRRAARPSTRTRSRRPRSSGCSARCCSASRRPWPTCSGPASSPAPRRARCSRRSPTTGSSEAMPDAVARLLGSLPVLKPVIPDPGIRFQLVHEDDVASAFAAGGARHGRARALQPRRQRHAHDVATWPTRSAGTRCRCRSRWWTPRRRSPRGCRSCRSGGLDPLGAQAGADEDRPGEEAAALAAEAHRAGATLKEMADAQRALRYSSA